MGIVSKISWCNATWNPWRGCHKVSDGCANCYMFRDQLKFGLNPETIVHASRETFAIPLKWKWQRLKGRLFPEPFFIFTCSWSDFFHAAADKWRDEAMEIIRVTPEFTYQILTKRPERAERWLEHNPLPDNVWLGVSVESQTFAYRLDVLARIPAVVKFVSVEPMLGPVNLRRWLGTWCPCGHARSNHDQNQGCTLCPCEALPMRSLDWVIIGGESGPEHRPMEIAWVQDIVAQCDEAQVPVWVKQGSTRLPGQQGNIPDALWERKAFP